MFRYGQSPLRGKEGLSDYIPFSFPGLVRRGLLLVSRAGLLIFILLIKSAIPLTVVACIPKLRAAGEFSHICRHFHKKLSISAEQLNSD